MSPSSQGGVTPAPAPAPAPRGWSLRLEVVCELVCHIPGPDPLQVRQCGTCQSGLDLHAAFGWALSEECRRKHIDMGFPLAHAPRSRLGNSSQPVDVRTEEVHCGGPDGSERSPHAGIHIVHPVATVSIPDDLHIDHPFDTQMTGRRPAGLRQPGIVETEQLAGRTLASRSAECALSDDAGRPDRTDESSIHQGHRAERGFSGHNVARPPADGKIRPGESDRPAPESARSGVGCLRGRRLGPSHGHRTSRTRPSRR